jgi:hypothetical protein
MLSNTRFRDVEIRSPRGTEITARSWLTEAPMRMLMNNLDPDVAENPKELVVYGGIGRAARDWESYDAIVAALKRLNDDETLLIQSGKPVGVFRTHADAPRVLIANSNLVPHWATWEHFNKLDAEGLMMYGQMTAGSWIYIGAQGIVAQHRMPAIPHRFPSPDALSRPAGAGSRRGPGAHCRLYRARRGHFDRTSGQCGGNPSRTGPARCPPRHGHRPDLGA